MGAGILIPIEDDRPAEISLIPLGQAGFAYVDYQLPGFGPLAVKTFDLFKGKGRIFAPLEKGTTPSEAKKFSEGKDSPTVAIRTWIANYITLHWGKDCQLIAEDPWMKLSDVIRHVKTGYFTIDDTPYYTPKEATMEQSFTTAAFEPHSWGFAVFVIDPPILPPSMENNSDSPYVQQLVENVKAVIISAYDSEGFVVWEI